VEGSPRPGQSDYEAKLLDKLDEAGAANYFVRRTPIGKFFDQASKKRFNATSALHQLRTEHQQVLKGLNTKNSEGLVCANLLAAQFPFDIRR
jgi:hypothetical protein